MRSCKQLLEALERGALDQNLSVLYVGGQIPAVRERAARVTGALMKSFHPIQKAALFSGPGRTEIGDNHTDHFRENALAGCAGGGVPRRYSNSAGDLRGPGRPAGHALL